MAFISIKRNVDLQPGLNAPAVFNCSQSDKGTTIMLGLMNGGNDYTVPSGVTITIRGSRSNGAVFTPVSATFSGSTVSFTLTEEMTDTAGPTLCEAVLEQGNNVLGTANFIINVEGSPMGADVPPVFTDAAWAWMVNKIEHNTIPSLGETIPDAIEEKADQTDLSALQTTVTGHTGSITVLNNTVNTLNQDVTENRQNIALKLDKNQGTANAGKYLKVQSTGQVVPVDLIDDSLLVETMAADAKATGVAISKKLNKYFGQAEAGKYLKVGTSGYVDSADLDVTTDKTLSIEDKAADGKATGDALVLKANESTIAPEFDSSASYTAGQYVYKNGVLYKFTAAHTGAWTGSDAETVTVGGEVNRKVDISQGIANAGKALVVNSSGNVEPGEVGNSSSVPIEVRQAMLALFNTAIYAEQGMENEIAIIENWANVSVESITLSPTALAFNTITSQTIHATLTPSDATATILWTSSNPSVATVSNGIVSSVGNGICTITASVGDISATCSVEVSGIATTYPITNTLTGCINTNTQARVEEGASYTATIMVDDGYLLPFTSIAITMGGTDITATAWNNGQISIPNVTGAIVITISATQDTRTLVAKWDFTKSLIDSVGGLEMVLSNTAGGESLPTRDANGLHFTAGAQRAYCSDYSYSYADGRIYEIDIASATFAGDSSKHKRFFGHGSDFFLIYRNAGQIQMYKGAWKTYAAETGKTIPSTTDALSGKTVAVKLGSDKTSYLYINGELIGKSESWTQAGYSVTGIEFGGTATGSANEGNQIHNMTITGFRIYEEEA